MQAFGEGLPTRVFAMTERPGQNLQHGMLMTTGRDLDVAVDGPGWIAVQDPNGAEAYTRMGNLQLNATGNLQTSTGLNVVDDAGQPIVLPCPWRRSRSIVTVPSAAVPRGSRQPAGRFPAYQAGQPGGRCGGERPGRPVSPQGWPE